jgi:hypothetical protein
MTDNVSITEGSGDKVIATDDVGGVQYQIVKLGYGDDGAATVVSTGASAVPIKDGGNSITVDFTTASKAQIDDLTTAHKIRVKSTAALAITATTASKIVVDDLTTASIVRAQSTGGFAVSLTTASKIVTEFAAAQAVTMTTASKVVVETTAALAVTLTTASKIIADVSSMGLAIESGGNLASAAASLTALEASNIEAGTDATPSVDVLTVGGSILHDSTDAGAPVKIGARAVAGLSGVTLVAAADRTNTYAGLDGAMYTRPHCGLEDLVKGTTTISASTVAVTCLASVASIKQYVTHVSATNTSTVNAILGLVDGTTPAIMSWACPANYSGFISNFQVPIAPASAGTKWALQTDTSLATVICNMAGFKSKI